MLFSTIIVGAPQCIWTVSVLITWLYLTVVETDTTDYIPPVMVPVTVSILSIPSLFCSQVTAVRSSLARSEQSLSAVPGIAHVLETSVVRPTSLGYISTVLICHTYWVGRYISIWLSV